MKRSSPDRYLGWALALSLAAHATALAAGVRLSAAPPEAEGFEEIQVFDSRAPMMVEPVSLVGLGEPESATLHVAQLPPPDTAPGQHPTTVRTPPSEGRVRPRQGPRRDAGGRAASAVSRSGGGTGPQTPVRDREGGGGGGPLDLGPPSANGNLPGAGEGTGSVGQVPGTGAGSGPGEGPGEGTGRGGGVGSGEGAGVGPGRNGATSGTAKPGAGDDGGGFVSRVADRAEPEVISKGELAYPESAAADGAEGTVQLKVLVTEEGRIAEAEVMRSSGDRRLDSAAKEFVRGWRYRPAVQDGQPRRVYSIATVVFELD